MADKPVDKTLLPSLLEQNPAPFAEPSQDGIHQQRSQVDRIMEVFLQLLPSNYVSDVPGPFYTLRYQAAAEQIAKFQIAAQEAYADSVYDYTRSEVLYQILGALVFPDAQTDGWPDIDGDISYRTFLKRMVILLLQGATKKTVKEGVELLTDATVEVIEKVIADRQLKGQSAWGFDDQFSFEINVESERTFTVGETTITLPDFPDDPFTLVNNARIVLRALKPAHTLYDFRFLFKESFGTLFSGTNTFEWSNYYYEDFRRYCLGAQRIAGTAGETLTDRALFSDPTRDFTSVQVGSLLTILTGPNSIHVGGVEGTTASQDEQYVGRYRVEAVLAFPVGTDVTPRSYTTSPTGLTGGATVDGDVIEDASQNWALADEGEILTFSAGPNAGSYRLKMVLGNDGGPVGFAPGPGTKVRVAPSILRIRRRMARSVTGQSYEVVVDRLGKQVPQEVEDEDATVFFLR